MVDLPAAGAPVMPRMTRPVWGTSCRARSARRSITPSGSRANLARAPFEQTGRNPLVHGRRPVTVDAAEEQLRRGATQRFGVLRHDGDARLEQVGERNLVKAHQPNLVMQVKPL